MFLPFTYYQYGVGLEVVTVPMVVDCGRRCHGHVLPSHSRACSIRYVGESNMPSLDALLSTNTQTLDLPMQRLHPPRNIAMANLYLMQALYAPKPPLPTPTPEGPALEGGEVRQPRQSATPEQAIHGARRKLIESEGEITRSGL